MKSTAYVCIHPHLTEWFVATCLIIGTIWHVKSLITSTPIGLFYKLRMFSVVFIFIYLFIYFFFLINLFSPGITEKLDFCDFNNSTSFKHE